MTSEAHVNTSLVLTFSMGVCVYDDGGGCGGGGGGGGGGGSWVRGIMNGVRAFFIGWAE